MPRSALVLTLFAGLLAAAVVSGCATARPPDVGDDPLAGADSTREALDAARARWQAAGLDDYRFTYSNSCFCPEDVRGPFTITVRDGVVREVLFQGGPVAADAQRHPTVEALFDRLAEAFDRGADAVRVAYDEALGYPAAAYVDYEAMAADEEDRFEVRDLVRLDR
jgi:hypothetical protein